MSTTIKLLLTGIVLFILFVLSGCGGPGGSKNEDGKGDYEKVWVDPVVLQSDSVYTLIQASRVDSIPKDEMMPSSTSVISIDFVVTRPNCMTTVNIVNEKREVLRPLTMQLLGAGYYKLTLNPNFPLIKSASYKPVFLYSEVCGTRKSVKISKY
ncbi:MAG: hypothetical protein SGI97_09665 [candidate division Zixibacteria bacterium]|nr:hypothetical protein [candidate division Zixibacteria bacterium]